MEGGNPFHRNSNFNEHRDRAQAVLFAVAGTFSIDGRGSVKLKLLVCRISVAPVMVTMTYHT